MEERKYEIRCTRYEIRDLSQCRIPIGDWIIKKWEIWKYANDRPFNLAVFSLISWISVLAFDTNYLIL